MLGSVLIFALPLGAELGTIAAAFAQSAPAQFPAAPTAAGQSQAVPKPPTNAQPANNADVLKQRDQE
ncbi:MAG: hypothetical protein WB774_20085, partial [Xanthobacteraceae bacterium]